MKIFVSLFGMLLSFLVVVPVNAQDVDTPADMETYANVKKKSN